MKVLIDALPLRQGGGVTYFQQQMTALAEVAPDLDLHTLVSPWSRLSDLPGTTEVVPVRSVPSRFAYELVRVPLRSTDVIYCPANFGPTHSRAPRVLTLHNANYYASGLALPETRGSRPWWKLQANYRAIRRADVVIAISQSLADDVAVSLPEVAPKLRVVLSGACVWPQSEAPRVALPPRYILSVTSAAPHKRLTDVVEGWRRSLDEAVHEVCALVLVGSVPGTTLTRLQQLAGRHVDRLHCIGPVSDRRELRWIYEHALALVSMSCLEAFPLTPHEAGAVGCPLVLSDIPPHREVSLGHATYVQLADVDQLAHILISEVYGDVVPRNSWQWPVSWQDNARVTADILRSVAAAA